MSDLPDAVDKMNAAIRNQWLEGAFVGRTLKPWTICELNTLRNYVKEHGFSAAFIAQLQLVEGRSKDSISGMMHRQGMGNEAARMRSKCARRLSDRQRKELVSFLQGDGRL